MEQFIITGANASGVIPALPGLGIQLQSLEIDLPLNEIGTTAPSVTLSGEYTGVNKFYSDTTLDLRYVQGESIYVTTSGFGATYSASIRYLRYGDQSGYMFLNNPAAIRPIPNRLK